MIKKFNETSIVTEMVEGFKTDLFGTLDPEDALMFVNRLTECTIRFLSKYKAKDVHAVVAIKELSTEHDFLWGVAADYHPSENDEEMPGNWTVTVSMDEAAIKETDKNMIIYSLQDDLYTSEMIRLLKKYAFTEFNDPSTMRQIISEVFKVLKNHMCVNAKNSTEPYELDCGLMTISAEYVDDAYVFNVELGGELKQLIKDDESASNVEILA